MLHPNPQGKGLMTGNISRVPAPVALRVVFITREADYMEACPMVACPYPPCPWWPPTCPILYQVELGQWERQSVALWVSEEYRQLYAEFKDYFKGEMVAIGDDTLEQEVTILETLSTYGE